MSDMLWRGQVNEAEEDVALARAIEEGLTAERVSRDEVMAILRAPDGN